MADPYNLQKRGKFYVADFIMYGVRVHRSTKKAMKGDAIKRCEGWAQEIIDRHDGKEPPKKAVTLREALAAWVKVQAGQVGDLHVTNVRCAVLTHAKAFLDTPIDQLNNEAMMQIRADYLATEGVGYRNGQEWRAVRKHTEGGANSVVRRISALLGWCVETKRIPMRPYKVKALKAQEHPDGIVWPERIQEFYAEADRGGPQHIAKDPKKREKQIRRIPDSAIAIRLMGTLGLREDEALGARWEWLDRRLKVYTVGESKNRKTREIPVPAWLMEFLEPIRGDKTRGLIIPSEKTDPATGEPLPRHKNFTQKPVERIAAKLDIPGMTPHRLRATFATTHWEAGTALSQIQQMMGHQDPETTMGYIVSRPKDQAQAQEKVAELQGFKPSPKIHPNRKAILRRILKTKVL